MKEEFQKPSVGMLGLRYPISLILSAFKFVKPFSSLTMQLIAVGVPCICRCLSCLKFESLIEMGIVWGRIGVLTSPVSMIEPRRWSSCPNLRRGWGCKCGPRSLISRLWSFVKWYTKICSTNELSTTPRRARCYNPGDLIYNEDRNGTENCRTDVASPSNWTILRVDPDAQKRAEKKSRVTRKGLSGI